MTKSAGETFAQLSQADPQTLSRAERALVVTLDFCLAVGRGDGERAAARVDVVGYHALPEIGDLPEAPERPLSRRRLGALIEAGHKAAIDHLPVTAFTVCERQATRAMFPAAAEWMLPHDLVVVIEPVPATGPDWIKRRACLVIRLRGRNAVVVGGNLLSAQQPAP
ncbi:MAG: hypothetical protein KKB50_06890 [Planctomycetes bacterium]|nr:hypothetical protein [Planctomycetota bacterium]